MFYDVEILCQSGEALGSWHMRFVDAVAWAQRHPVQDHMRFSLTFRQSFLTNVGSVGNLQGKTGWNSANACNVGWENRHDSGSAANSERKEIYMNQAMVADLGSDALNQLKIDVPEISGLKLVSPSLWLSSGKQAALVHARETC